MVAGCKAGNKVLLSLGILWNTLVAQPVVEQLFKQDPMTGICEPATWLLRSWPNRHGFESRSEQDFGLCFGNFYFGLFVTLDRGLDYLMLATVDHNKGFIIPTFCRFLSG